MSDKDDRKPTLEEGELYLISKKRPYSWGSAFMAFLSTKLQADDSMSWFFLDKYTKLISEDEGKTEAWVKNQLEVMYADYLVWLIRYDQQIKSK